MSAERLAECVWGDDGGARGAGGLHSYVSHLRRRLQPDAGARSRTDVITRVGRGYALRVGPLAVDAWRFEHALQASADLPAVGAGPSGCAPRWSSGAVPAYAEYADEPWAATEVGAADRAAGGRA